MVIIAGSGKHALALQVILASMGIKSVLRDGESLTKSKWFNVFYNGYGNKSTVNGSGLEKRALAFRTKMFGLKHPSAVILGDCQQSCQVFPLSYIGPNAVVYNNVIINTAAVVEHDCSVGIHCHIAPNATLCGSVKVGGLTHIGAGSVVLQGLTIGSNCVVGAGSVVTKNMPNNTTWIGTKFYERTV